MKNFAALALASIVAAFLAKLNGNLNRGEFIVLLALLPVFRMAISQLCDHYRDYIAATVEIMRSIRSAAVEFWHRVLAYDWKALALRILRASVNAGRNFVHFTIIAAKAVYRFICWLALMVEKADIPGNSIALANMILEADFPGKIDAALAFMVEKLRHGKEIAISKADTVKGLVEKLVERSAT